MAEGGGFLYTQAIQPVDAGKNFRDIAAFLQKKKEEERARQDKLDAEKRQFAQQERMAGIQSQNQIELAERQSELRKEEKAADQARTDAKELNKAIEDARKSRKEAVKEAYGHDVSALPDWAEAPFNSWVEKEVQKLSDLLVSDSFDEIEAQKILNEIETMYEDLSSAIPTEVTNGLETMSSLLDAAKLEEYNNSLDPTQEVDVESLNRVVETKLSITGDDVSTLINQMRADGEVVPEGNWSFDIEDFVFRNDETGDEMEVSEWSANLLRNKEIYTPQTKNRVVGTLEDYAVEYLKPRLVGQGEDYNEDAATEQARELFNNSPSEKTRGIRIAAADKYMKNGFEDEEIAAFINGNWDDLPPGRQAALNNVANQAAREMAKGAKYEKQEVTGTRDVQAEKEAREKEKATEALIAASTEYDTSLAVNFGVGTIPIVIEEGGVAVDYKIYAVNINKDSKDLSVRAYDVDGNPQRLDIPYGDPNWGAVNTGFVGFNSGIGIEQMLEDDWLEKVMDAGATAPPIPTTPPTAPAPPPP